MTLNANWSFPTQIRFGTGRLKELPDACAEAGISRPLVVTDKVLRELPLFSEFLDILDRAGLGCSVFSNVDPNPTDRNLDDGLSDFKEGEFDGVVSIGGGSSLDLGKMIAFMSGQSRPVWDFEDVGENWKLANSSGISPSIAIPTTAGTGSEVGRASVITNTATTVKKIIFHPSVLPRIVIADPETTLGLPRSATAGTGMDAFAHCLEAYCAPGYHPMCQGIALEGLRLATENLAEAVENGSNVEARANMMCAASMGAVAFQKGLGAVHALSHPVGAMFNTHHGTTNAVVLLNVLKFNECAIREKLSSVSAYLNLGSGFEDFYKFVEGLLRDIGIPKNLQSLGADPDRIDQLAKMAIEDPTASSNPIPLTYDGAYQLYQKCFDSS
ncbi:MAG: iron-containing alcohol dehydrogenase [Albidovulum sp.]|nr:iron-containing alcohol dehydrogenase [Albidovulum sp.]